MIVFELMIKSIKVANQSLGSACFLQQNTRLKQPIF
jgi:hypothetical protein